MPRLPKYLDLEGLKYYDQKLKEYINWDSGYQKPEDGIPLEDLEVSVQQSLANADTALQSETDPTVPAWAKAANKPTYTAAEIGAVPTTTTVNGKALSSDITLSASDVNALPANTFIPTKTSDITNDSGYITSADITDVYKYKGSKTNYSELPTTGNTVGDVWNVANAYNNYPAGTNFAWDGSTWDALGGSVDLSGYVPTSRTINGQALTSDIVLSANDVNALPSSTVVPDQLSDLSDDSTHRTVTDAEKTAWNNKYDKPQGGIAKTDLDSSVQDSLDLADSALQPEDIASELTNSNQPVSASAVYNVIVEEEEVISAALNDLNSRIENMVVEETDPTVPAWAKEETKPTYTASEVGAVPTSRTVNGKSLSSNITLTASDVNALPTNTKLSDLTNDAGFISSSDLVDEVSQEDKPITANAVYEYITELEKVIASALNDLNTRLSTYSDKELVIAASLNDLNSRLKTLEG